MGKIDFKKARKLLPYGAIGVISKKTKVNQSEISRIFRGLECNNALVVEKEIINQLKELYLDLGCFLNDYQKNNI